MKIHTKYFTNSYERYADYDFRNKTNKYYNGQREIVDNWKYCKK